MQANKFGYWIFGAFGRNARRGNFDMTNSSLSKMHNSLVMRETVALAREVVGERHYSSTDVAPSLPMLKRSYFEGT